MLSTLFFAGLVACYVVCPNLPIFRVDDVFQVRGNSHQLWEVRIIIDVPDKLEGEQAVEGETFIVIEVNSNILRASSISNLQNLLPIGREIL